MILSASRSPLASVKIHPILVHVPIAQPLMP